MADPKANTRRPAKAAIAIIWAFLFAMSVSGVVRGVSFLYTVPMNYYQVFNIVSIFYNLFLFIGCVKFHVPSLRAAEQILALFSGLLVAFAFVTPILMSSFMASGVFQSTRIEDIDAYTRVELFLRDEVHELPVGFRHLYSNILDYLLLKVKFLRGPFDNFKFGVETGMIGLCALLSAASILHFQYMIIARFRKHIIKRRIEDARLSQSNV